MENKTSKDERDTRKVLVPPLILESDRHWKTLHSWMVRNGVESKSEVTRDGGLHINTNDALDYRKLQDHLQKEKIFYHSFALEKPDLRVVLRGLPMSPDLRDDLEVQGIPLREAQGGRSHSSS